MNILHTNDFHGALDDSGARHLAELRKGADVWVDSGDAIKAGNLAIPLRRESIWDLLGDAGCDIGTLGNRETHVLESAFRAKIEGARHRLICANLLDKETRGPALEPTAQIVISGLRVTFVGVMVPMVTEKMASRMASAYIWEAPIPVARRYGEEMRPHADLLIAITHIGLSQDRILAAEAPMYDLILGGHSHDVLATPERHGDTWICQGGSHGRYVGRYRWDGGLIESELVPLK